MTRAIENRLGKLEAMQKPPQFQKVHRVIGSASECQAKIRDLLASGAARECDLFLERIIVDWPTGGRSENPVRQSDYDVREKEGQLHD